MITQSFVQRMGIFFCFAIFLFVGFAQFAHALVPPLCTGTRYSYTKIVAIDKGSLPTGVIVEGEGEDMYLNNTTGKPLVFKFLNVNRTVRLVDGKVYSNTLDSHGSWFEDELEPRGLSITFLLNDGPYVGINTPSQLPAPARFSAALQYDNQPINITGTITYKLHEYDCAGKDVYVATFSTQTTVSVQAQIDALLKQITQLQTQIAALRGQSAIPTTGTSSCLDLNNALVIGSTDSTTSGEVSKLQRFLLATGVYPEALITGYYGSLTAQAVVRWQKAHGMDFVTLTSGVGPMTRAKFRAACSAVSSCVNGPVQTTEGLREGIPVITSITPASGQKGTAIKITGCNLSGFEGDHDVTFESSNGVKTTLVGAGTYQLGRGERGTFVEVTVKEPCQRGETVTGRYSGMSSQCNFVELTPGEYKVSTTPWGRTSNEMTFTITSQ